MKGVLEIFDADEDGQISRDEWMHGWYAGKRLPDYGVSDATDLAGPLIHPNVYNSWRKSSQRPEKNPTNYSSS